MSPFKSKKQMAWMFAAEKRGEVRPGTAEEWAAATPSMKDLPERAPKPRRPAKPKTRRK